MTLGTNLQGRRILVVEDVYLIADDVCRALVRAGAEVVGPAGTVADALVAMDAGTIDAAVLDVNLDGTPSFAIAGELERRSVPFLFATGYDDWALPDMWRDKRRIGKPFNARSMLDALVSVIAEQPMEARK